MLNNLSFKYYPTNSYVHRLNPIIKVLATFIFFVTIFITNNLFVEVILLLFTTLIIFLSNVSFKLFFKAIWKMKYFLLMYIVINLLCGGTYLGTLIVVIRFINVILYSFLLTYTTKSSDITYALEKIFSPLKSLLPVKAISLIITMALQFIPIIIDQTNKIMKSLASRGKDYKVAKLDEKWDILKAIVFPMFILSLKRADEVADAYEVRYYNLKEEIVPFNEKTISVFDYFYLIIHILFLIVVIILEVML